MKTYIVGQKVWCVHPITSRLLRVKIYSYHKIGQKYFIVVKEVDGVSKVCCNSEQIFKYKKEAIMHANNIIKYKIKSIEKLITTYKNQLKKLRNMYGQ